MLLDNLLDLRLHLGGDLALCDLFEESSLCRGQVSTELSFPLDDLFDGDGVKLESNDEA